MTFDDRSAHADHGQQSIDGEDCLPSSKFWTTAELSTLRAIYPVGGSFAAHAALPNRTRAAIMAKAQQLDLRAPRQHLGTAGKKLTRRWEATEQIDQAIRDGYATARKRGDYKAIAERVNRPQWWVQKRAARLGVTRTNRSRLDAWRGPELEMLEDWAHCDPSVIRRKLAKAGFQRTVTAISIQLKRRKFDRTDPDRWAAPELAELLGVNAATVADWIERRGLKAVRKAYGPHGRFMLHRRDVRAWIKLNPRYVDLRRVDQPWFMDLVFGGTTA